MENTSDVLLWTVILRRRMAPFGQEPLETFQQTMRNIETIFRDR